MDVGAWVLVGVLAAALAVGGLRLVRDGRFRGTRRVRGARAPVPEAVSPPSVLDGLPHDLGERATLLQFSSAFCAPCRAARRVLADVAAAVPGVAHVELDAEHHLDLVRRLGVLRTPTTLVLDARGREVTRAAGVPRRDAVLVALSSAVEP